MADANPGNKPAETTKEVAKATPAKTGKVLKKNQTVKETMLSGNRKAEIKITKH